MNEQRLNVRSVAVIGAGVSGVAAAIHLKRAGLEVTVFERSSQAGGIWVYNESVSNDAAYPSVLPSIGDSPEYEQRWFDGQTRQDSPMRELEEEKHAGENAENAFAPPGPCYIALKNNVSTIEMEMTTHSWKPGTEEFVPHHILADYIQGAATANGINDFIRFNTRVTNVVKEGSQWRVETAKHLDSRSHAQVQQYDGLVIATGHYHACNIPDIPGLSEWKRRFTTRVWHSKRYRKPDQFKGQNVLLVGAGVSSIDIARDLGSVAASIYQSSRGGMYDLPSHLLPDNAARVGGVKSFDVLDSSELVDGGSIPGTITLVSGEKLCNIHQVILCTGYHVSFPFMKQYHADALRPEEANEEVLVTDGQVTHNLHKDIWYIPDPTLAFMGVPYHTATFTLFEFQAMGLAAVFSGEVLLPLMEEMRKEYRERVKRKGAGRTLHSLKDYGLEAGYVNELVDMVNEGLLVPSKKRMTGHSTTWLEAYERRRKRLELLLSNVRDPSLDHRTLEQVVGC